MSPAFAIVLISLHFVTVLQSVDLSQDEKFNSVNDLKFENHTGYHMSENARKKINEIREARGQPPIPEPSETGQTGSTLEGRAFLESLISGSIHLASGAVSTAIGAASTGIGLAVHSASVVSDEFGWLEDMQCANRCSYSSTLNPFSPSCDDCCRGLGFTRGKCKGLGWSYCMCKQSLASRIVG